jgi:molybdopterin synthase sulfur carrier subunit
MPTVRIPTVLRKHTDGQSKVEAAGQTVGEVFDALIAAHPAIGEQLIADGAVRGFINVYVEDEDIRYLDGLASAVAEGDQIAIMPAVAGGAEPEASTHGALDLAGGAA